MPHLLVLFSQNKMETTERLREFFSGLRKSLESILQLSRILLCVCVCVNASEKETISFCSGLNKTNIDPLEMTDGLSTGLGCAEG